MKIKRDQCLALIIDDQIRLLPSISESALLLQNTGILLQGLRILEVPLLITQQYTKGLGMSDPSIFHYAGTEHYLEKRSFSCWGDSEIRRLYRIPAAVRSFSPESKPTSVFSRPLSIFWKMDMM